MQTSPKFRLSPKVDLLLFDAFSNHCLANTVEPLRAANALSGRCLFDWRYLTLDGAPVESSSGLRVAPHAALLQGRDGALFVMPSYGVRGLDTKATERAMRGSAGRYTQVAGLDTGSWLMARAGLLDGRRATIHWDELTAFSEAFPELDAVRERFVIDGPCITCAGAMAAFDLILHLIAAAHGPMLALDVAQLFNTQDRAMPVRMGGRSVQRAVEIMGANLEHPLRIKTVAQQVGCTQKTLEHRMQSGLGATPQAIYRRLRLAEARKLVETSALPVAEIACRCGYDTASALTRAFRSEFATTPRDLRRGQV